MEKLCLQNKDFEHIKDIGEGAYGVVNLVSRKSNNQILALKILDKRVSRSFDNSISVLYSK